VHTFGNGVTLRTSGIRGIMVNDVSSRSISGNVTVQVSGGAAPAVLALGGNAASTGGRIDAAVRRQAPQSRKSLPAELPSGKTRTRLGM